MTRGSGAWLSRVPPPLAYGLLGAMMAAATWPVWRIMVFGLTLDDLLRLVCG